ncbi:19280_t:CDS:2, partial [Dentiscutata erythropus]
LDHLDFTAQRLGYPDDASRDPDVLNNFIEKELYKRLDYANYNIQSKKFSQYIDQSQSEDDINNESTQEESSQEESDQEISEIESRETNCFNIKKKMG